MAAIEIRVYPANADLPDHLRWQIISIIRMEWHEAIGDYTGPAALPDELHPSHVVGVEGDAIVSYTGVVWTDIEYAGQVFRTYGLSSVFTFPARRRRGFGTRVVQRATTRIREAGDADIAVLFTAPDRQRFYERCGWEFMPATEFLIGDRTAPKRHDAVAMMLFVSAKGVRHHTAFERARVYLGEEPW